MKRITFLRLALSTAALLAGTPGGGAQEPLAIQPGVELVWPTRSGNTYQLQWAAHPGEAGPWTALGPAGTGNGSMGTYFDPVHPRSRHYRVLEIVPGSGPVSDVPANGGFEAGTGGAADQWTASHNQPPARSSAEAHSGSFSMHSVLLNVGSAPSEGMVRSIPAPEGGVAGGQTHAFSFWAKQISSGASYIQQHRVEWLDAGGTIVGSTGLANFNGGNGSWTEVRLPGLVAPMTAAGAKISFRFVTGAIAGGSGEIFIDDVRLATAGEGPTGPGQTNIVTVETFPVAEVSWATTLGTHYQPVSSGDLSPATWTHLTPLVVGNNATRTIRVPVTRSREFIRVESAENPGIVPLFDAGTILEPPTTVETGEALITRVGDRGRGRHAREDGMRGVGAGPLYDVYLSFYWEGRTVAIEIVDRIARGGNSITINIASSSPLATKDFRAFFRGINTVAEYHHNAGATEAGPNQYTTTLTYNPKAGRAIQIGDRMEFEFSPFLDSPANGRANYYGTAMLYIVGEGIKPWYAEGALLDSFPLPETAWLGGGTTQHRQYSNEPRQLFKQMAGNLAPTNTQPFMLGRRLHHTDFDSGNHSEGGNPGFLEHAGKVGPRFINRSCVACHTDNGRALPPPIGEPMFQTVMKVGNDAGGSPNPVMGSVLQPQSIGEPAEGSAVISGYSSVDGQYLDGTPYSLQTPDYALEGTAPAHFSVRLAQPLVGLGLLEAISEGTVLALADPEDADGNGVSGRAQSVVDPETGQLRMGRFGYKAGKARLRQQIASALNTDMGVTTAIFPLLDGESTGGTPELGALELDRMTRYIAVLAVNPRRDLTDPQTVRGEQLFGTAGCADCHIPTLITSSHHPMTELRDQTIHPFTDLLLHDLGPGLADTLGEGVAEGAEWRTAPLWGIGHTTAVSGGEAYLHDGRARTLEEAILWHGGEGEASKEAFRTMPAADRAALIAFLKSL